MSNLSENLLDILFSIVSAIAVLVIWNWIAKPAARLLEKGINKMLRRETATA